MLILDPVLYINLMILIYELIILEYYRGCMIAK